MYHNIDKSAFRKGEYVGHAASGAWRIRKASKGWEARETRGTALLFGQTLGHVSLLLEAANEAYTAELRAKRLPNPFTS
jgi:hypothetical protein